MLGQMVITFFVLLLLTCFLYMPSTIQTIICTKQPHACNYECYGTIQFVLFENVDKDVWISDSVKP